MLLGQHPGICSPGDEVLRGCRSPGQHPAVRARLLMPLCRGGGVSQNRFLTHQLYGMVSAILPKVCFALQVLVVAVSPPASCCHRPDVFSLCWEIVLQLHSSFFSLSPPFCVSVQGQGLNYLSAEIFAI